MVKHCKHFKDQIKQLVASYRDGITAGLRAEMEKRESVVRCEKCESFRKGKCDNPLGLPNPYPDSFCSFGVRRKKR